MVGGVRKAGGGAEGSGGGDLAVRCLRLLAGNAPREAFEELAEGAELPEAVELALRARGQAEAQQQRAAGMAALVDALRDLTQVHDLDEQLRILCRRARLLLGLDMAYVSLPCPDSGDSRARVADGAVTTLVVGLRIPAGGPGVGGVIRSRLAPFWTPDYLADDRFPHEAEIDEAVRAEGTRAVLAVPLLRGCASVGVLYGTARSVRHFTPDEVALLSSLGDIAAIAIDTAHQLERTAAELLESQERYGAALRSADSLRAVVSAQRRMTETALESDAQGLAELGAELFDGSVRILTDEYRPVGDAGPGGASGIATAEWSRSVERARESGTAVQDGSGCWVSWVGRIPGQDGCGFVVVRPGEAPADGPAEERRVALLRQFSLAADFQMLLCRTSREAGHQARGRLLYDLLAAATPAEERLARARAVHLGLAPDGDWLLLAARPDGDREGRLERSLMWAVNHTTRAGGMATVRDQTLVLAVPGSGAGKAARDVAHRLTEALGTPVTTGAADIRLEGGVVSGTGGLRGAFREAVRCVDALTALGRSGQGACADELGFLGVLLSQERDVPGYVRSVLGPVLDHDERRSTGLLETLEAYFASGAELKGTAERLHVHTNTVVRRLERVASLLGTAWQEPARALEVQLALGLRRTARALDD
ncbi:helix-turn-helix domain-containing protein [Streptomyces sp. NRRL B-1347]|uniref:helix-turn-helix domain-containing protein n=1 Tax=Streptomyces sp. NRRL B-1347 TaxID=1476877 RepID=UPI0007C5CA59|nr:helix-turn-helix domain-containing protein [Streptomyces sp. NRRL B-1347]